MMKNKIFVIKLNLVKFSAVINLKFQIPTRGHQFEISNSYTRFSLSKFILRDHQ
jgi:hypothetical protein